MSHKNPAFLQHTDNDYQPFFKTPEMELQSRSTSAWQNLEKAWSSVGVLKEQLAKTQQKLDRASKGYTYSDPSPSTFVSSSMHSGKPLRTLKTIEPLTSSKMNQGFMRDTDYQSLNVHNNDQSFMEDLPEKLPATTLAWTIKSTRMWEESSSSSKDSCLEEVGDFNSVGLGKWTYNSGIPTWLQQKNLGSEHVVFSEWEKQFLLKELSDFGDFTSETNSEALRETKVCFINDQNSVLQYQRTPVLSEQLRYIPMPGAKSGLEKIKDLIERQKKDFTDRASVNAEAQQSAVEVFITPRPIKSPDLEVKKEVSKDLEQNATDLPSELHRGCTCPKKVHAEIQLINQNVSRKVAPAPTIPVYRGFSASGKINTNRMVQERKQVKQEPERTSKGSKEISNTVNISPGKRIRKRKKSPKLTNSNLIITPATWREERALVLQKLGALHVSGSPSTQVGQSSQVQKSDVNKSTARKGENDSTDKHKANFQDMKKEVHSSVPVRPDRSEGATATLSPENKIAGKVRTVLKDLQSYDAERDDSFVQEDEVTTQQPSSKKPKRMGSKKRKALKQSELEQKAPAPKVRHYDPTVVRQYISKQKSERRKQMVEERQKTVLAEERKLQQLQQLYAKQKITVLASIKKPTLDNDNKKQSESDMIAKPTSTPQNSQNNEEEHTNSSYLETVPLSTSLAEESSSANQINDLQSVCTTQPSDVKVECTSYELPAIVAEGSSHLLKSKSFTQQETFVHPVVKNLQTLATSIQSRIDEESRRLKALLEGVRSDDSSQCLTLPGGSEGHVSVEGRNSLSKESLPGIGDLRAHQRKQQHHKLTQAAVKIQSVFRGYKTRKELRKLRENNMIVSSVFASEEKDTDDSLSEGPLLSDDGKENCSKRLIEAWQDNSEKTLKHKYSFRSNWNIPRTPDPFNFISAWQQKQMFPLQRIQSKTDSSFKLNLQLASKTSPDMEYSADFTESSVKSSETSIRLHTLSESLSHNTSSSSLTVSEKRNDLVSGGFTNSQDEVDEISSRIYPSVKKQVSVAVLEKDSAEKTVPSNKNSKETSLNAVVSRKDSYEELDVSDTLSEGSLSSGTLSEGRISALNASGSKESRKETSSSVTLRSEDHELKPFSGVESKHENVIQRSSTTSSDAVIPTRNSVSVRHSMIPENRHDQVKPQDLSRLPPSSLGIRLSAELTYLDDINESLLQLSEVSRVHAVSSARQDVISVANILEDVQQSHKKEHRELHQEIQRQQHELDLIRHSQQQMVEDNAQRAFTDSAQKLMNYQARAAVATAEAARELAKVKVTPLKEFGALWQQHSEGTTRLISTAAAAAATSAVTAVFQGQQQKSISFREKPGTGNEKLSDHLSYTSDFEQVSTLPSSKLEDVSEKLHDVQLSGVSESVTERNRSKLSSSSSISEDKEVSNDTAEHVSDKNNSKFSSVSEDKGMSDTVVSEHLHEEAGSNQPSAASCVSEQISTVREKNENTVSEHLYSLGEKNESFISDHTLSRDESRQFVTSRFRHKKSARSRSSKTEDRSTENTEQYEEGVPKLHSSKLVLPTKDHRSHSHSRNKPSSISSTSSTSDQESQFSVGLLLYGEEKEGSVPSLFSEESFTNFTVNMVRRLAKEEELRARHQLALLQLQEKALVDKARSEMAWLELAKRNFRLKGSENKVPSVRKRQRGILMKLKQERSEIQRLQQAHRSAAKNRREFLEQQEKVKELKSGVCQKEDINLEEEIEIFSKKSRSSSNSESLDYSGIISKAKKNPSLNSKILGDSVSEHVSTESAVLTEEAVSEHVSTESVVLTEESVSEHISTESVDATEESIKPATDEDHEISEGSETPSLESVVEAIGPTSSQTTSSKTSIPTSLKSEKRIEKPVERHKLAEKGADKSLSRLKGSSDMSSKQTSREGHLKLKAGKRYLTKREQNLHQRRKDLEHLIKWQHQLDKQEAEVRKLEKKALELLDTDRKSMAITEYSSTEKRTRQTAESPDKTILNSTTITTQQIQGSTSVSSKEDRKERTRTSGSDSSVAEDLSLHDQSRVSSDSILEEVIQCTSRISPAYDKKDGAQNVADLYSESFESADNSVTSNPSAQKISKRGSKSEEVSGGHRSFGIMIRSPLVPRSHRRHDSSGSEDSLTISLSETASDQSDIEGRIFALKEELRHRRLVAERLKKDQKQIYRERLKEREQSLKKQIEAYDKFIQKTKQDLDQELETSVLSSSSLTPLQIKPQIKQPRVAESRRLCKQLKLDKSQSSGEVSPVKLCAEVTAVDDATELGISKSEQEISTLLPYSRDEQKSTDFTSSGSSKSQQDNTGTVQSYFKDKQDCSGSSTSGYTYDHEVKKALVLGFEDEHKYKNMPSLNSRGEQEFSMCKEVSVVSDLYVSKSKNTDSVVTSSSNKHGVKDKGPSISKDQFVSSESEEEVKESVPSCEVNFDILLLSGSKSVSQTISSVLLDSRPEEQISESEHSKSRSVPEGTESVPSSSSAKDRISESESGIVHEVTGLVHSGSRAKKRISESEHLESRSVPEGTESVPSSSSAKEKVKIKSFRIKTHIRSYRVSAFWFQC
ncbi:centrosome-associated protein 350-like isoform X2 [Limulus polyphemus]|uniref:Centrosome-associated protein 350-like isoform X2 n=1 Tax=Limulus polyphemus TaxID=6850 RepID=A0ABM1T2C8_LIMPO|nr:centrosome-associated protein 350-like isoform X2 [Limulus polyphemus]